MILITVYFCFAGKATVIGGEDSGSPLDSIEQYDLDEGVWSVAVKLSSPYTQHATAVVRRTCD
jgi:hypothetical protein